MGFATITVSPALLSKLLRLPGGVYVVGASECADEVGIDLRLASDIFPDDETPHLHPTVTEHAPEWNWGL